MEEIDRTTWIETVLDQDESWLVNGVKSIPKSQVGGQASQVQQWIEEGGRVSYPPGPTKDELTAQVDIRRQQEYLRKVFPLIVEQYEGKRSQAEVTQEIEKIKQENPYPTVERENARSR